jgi:hypothetical protein
MCYVARGMNENNRILKCEKNDDDKLEWDHNSRENSILSVILNSWSQETVSGVNGTSSFPSIKSHKKVRKIIEVTPEGTSKRLDDNMSGDVSWLRVEKEDDGWRRWSCLSWCCSCCIRDTRRRSGLEAPTTSTASRRFPCSCCCCTSSGMEFTREQWDDEEISKVSSFTLMCCQRILTGVFSFLSSLSWLPL